MSAYNYSNTMNPNFDITAPPTQLRRAAGGMPINSGGPMTDRLMNPSGYNKAFMQETNVSVKATVKTRTTDQRTINQHQLAFIYNKQFDKPLLLNLQQMNQLLAGGDPLKEEDYKRIFGTDDPATWSKEYIKNNFKLIGTVVNRDTDLDRRTAIDRVPRAFTMCVRGDCHVLDYWSNKHRTLKKYDICYLILKKVWISDDHRYQPDMGLRVHNLGHVPTKTGNGRYCWQYVPYHTTDRSVRPEVYKSITCVKHHKRFGEVPVEATEVNMKSPNVEKIEEIGSYLRVGFTHEYASIGNSAMFDKRDELSVSRDITYLVDSGMVRPLQFYLWLDDETKMV